MCFLRLADLTGVTRGIAVAGLLMPFVRGSDTPPLLSNLTREFDGSPVSPVVATDPPGQPVTLVYRALSQEAPAEQTELVFNNLPDQLPLSFPSLNFANGVNALGNYVRLGGSARQLQSCEVVLVTWATASQYPDLALVNPAGYVHPVHLTLYTVSPAKVLRVLATADKDIMVPWRPEALRDGQAYPFNGYAFTASFNFTEEVTLPEQVMVVVDYDTERTGFTPLGKPGPYNILNVALDGTTPDVGADVNEDEVLRVAGETWYYPNTNWSGFNGPMTRIRARTTVTKRTPSEPGKYQVTASLGNTGTEGKVQEIFTITAPSYTSWQAREFTDEEKMSGRAEPFSDADGDGLRNLVEYGIGTPPKLWSGTPWIPDSRTRSLVLERPRWLTGIRCFAEESTDLKKWSPVPLEIIDRSSTKETIRAKASPAVLSGPSAYLRFRFSE